MLKSVLCLLTLFLVQATEAPFWKAKTKAYEHVQNGEILVTVHGRETSPTSPTHTLTTVGGAQINVPRDFLFATAQKYDQLPSASDYIKSASYDAAKQQVTLDIEAFAHKAHFEAEVHPVKDSEPWRIDYRMVSGPFQGMKGQITFAEIGAKRSEIGFDGEFKYDTFPVPRFFLEFGVEVVLQRMATRLRAYTEDEYRKNHGGAVATPATL